MQKLYTINFYAGLIACAGLALWLVFAMFSPLVMDSQIVLPPEMALFLAFLLLNLFFYRRNKERLLRLPQFASERATKIRAALLFYLALAFLAYGFYSYPDAPLKPDAGSFTDKAGNRHT